MPDDARGLLQLLASEVERRLSVFAGEVLEVREVRAALHALRGSAAVAGEPDLALVLAQFGARVRQGDESAIAEARDLLTRVAERLRASEPPFANAWPEPPEGLRAARVDARYRSEYLAAMRDRLSELDTTLESSAQPSAVLDSVYRTVHTMKGAATAVGDDTTAWYCHGLEARLKSAAADDWAIARELEQHRLIIRMFIEHPEEALEHLRRRSGGGVVVRDSEVPPRHPTSAHPSRPPSADEDTSAGELLLRVPGAAIDRFVERLERIDLVPDELSGAADVARQLAYRLRDMRSSLHDALRLIGPPRPWGAPAAALQRIEASARTLGVVAENAERGAQLCRRNADVVRVKAAEMRADLSALRRTSLGWIFERVANAVVRLAEGQGQIVDVTITGGDLAIDRRVADRLIDPVLQLAQNAVAHGIQAPEVRVRAGKPPVGKLALEAERIGDWLRITVEDDGRGVDVRHIRELALAHGSIYPELLQGAHEDELLGLLFTPGLTTQEGADLLAGRGVGLDLVREAVRRLGGAIRLGSRAGGGLVATIEVPGERGVMDVVWVEAAHYEFALPLSFTGRIERVPIAGPVASLASCLGLGQGESHGLALELVIHGVSPISIGVDRMGAVEEAHIRPIPSVVAAIGPYSGAVLRGDGSLRLALDAALLAARAWAQAVPAP